MTCLRHLNTDPGRAMTEGRRQIKSKMIESCELELICLGQLYQVGHLPRESKKGASLLINEHNLEGRDQREV